MFFLRLGKNESYKGCQRQKVYRMLEKKRCTDFSVFEVCRLLEKKRGADCQRQLCRLLEKKRGAHCACIREGKMCRLLEKESCAAYQRNKGVHNIREGKLYSSTLYKLLQIKDRCTDVKISQCSKDVWRSKDVQNILEKENFVQIVSHRLNMELDLQSLFGLLFTAVLIG